MKKQNVIDISDYREDPEDPSLEQPEGMSEELKEAIERLIDRMRTQEFIHNRNQ